MKIHPNVTADKIIAAVKQRNKSLDNPGFCILCGIEAMGVEPDACKYVCESCGKRGVYGADELLFVIPWA